MSSLLLLGNGESRQGIDINLINMYKVGCNAIYRDFYVDELVCVDRRMVIEACENGYTNTVYTRPNWAKHFKSKYPNVTEVPKLPYEGTQRHDDPFHWGSGPYAVLLGAKLSVGKIIKLIGFDLYSKDSKVNNIYKDTKNYAAADSRSVDPKYWIQQIARIFSIYKSRQFKIYQSADWQVPESWKQPNVEVDKISNIM